MSFGRLGTFGTGFGRLGHAPRTPWWLSGSSLDMDFAKNRARQAGRFYAPSLLLTTTRASDAYADSNSGFWQAFTSGVPRITDRGLLVEEARTNSIRNNSMQGAVVGVIGSGGALPTYWATAGGAVSTIEVVGVGTQNGIDYIDIRFAGTPSSTGPQTLYPDLVTGIAAQVWTNSLWVSLVAGSLTNIGSGGLFALRAGDEAGGTMFAPDSSFTRQTNTRTLASTEAGTKLRWAYGDTVTAVDFTLRIGWPQCELGSFATSPIRTTSAAATRAADNIVVSSSSWITQGSGTIFGEAVLNQNPSANSFLAQLWAGSNNDDVRFYVSTTPLITGDVTSGAASQAALTRSVTPTSVFKAAYAYATNSAILAAGGSISAEDTSVTVPTGFNQLQLGRFSGGSFVLNGYIRRVAYFPTRLTNAQLQAITAP